MDSFVLKAIASELDAGLRGATVDKVLQPHGSIALFELSPRSGSSKDAREVLETLPRPSDKKPFRLLISVDPNLPRVHLTTASFPNPKSPPPFCMLLRKHLSGARIVNVTLRRMERILQILFERRDPVGRIERYTLIAEIMGRHSNLFLLDTKVGMVLDALKMVPRGRSAARPVQRNAPYEPPPIQNKGDSYAIEEGEFRELVGQKAGRRRGEKASPRQLVDKLAGISPDVASYIFDTAPKGNLWVSFEDARKRFMEGRFSPGILSVGEGDEGAVWVLPPPAGKRFAPFPSANAAADELYGRSWENRRLSVRKGEMVRELNASLDRRRRTCEKVRKDLTRSEEAGAFQQKGEILLANLGSVPKGAESIRLKDVATAEEVEIPLDVRLSAQQNAERYFSKAKKLRRMAVSSAGRLKKVESEVTRLEALLETVNAATREAVLEKAAAELRDVDPAKRTDGPPARDKPKGRESAKKKASSAKSRDGKAAGEPGPGRPQGSKEAEPAAVPGTAKNSRRKRGSRRKKEGGAGGGAERRTAEKAPDAGENGVSPALDGGRPSALSGEERPQRRKSGDYRCFVQEGGWEILVGKHDRGNDRLLRQVAKSDDVWLHAQGVPGSHVIIHHAERGKEVPERVLEDAAKLAAYFSKGKGSAKVAVDYTAVRQLRRVKGGRPGQVVISGQKTLMVPPVSPERLMGSDPPEEPKAIA